MERLLRMVFSPRGRAFLVCEECEHWVVKLSSLCNCSCHRPSVKADEALLNK